MPSLSLIPQNGLNNPYAKKRDVIGEMLAGANVAPNGQKTYSGNQLMPLVNKNVTGQPTALPNIGMNLVPTGVVFPSTKSNKGAGLAKIANMIPKDETAPTNPKVKEYLTQKYSSKTTSKGEAPKTEDKPNLPVKQEIDLEKGEDQANERLSKILAIVGGGLSSYGSGLLGQGTTASGNQMMNTINSIKEREKEINFNNPKSRESVHARNLAKQLYGQDYKVDPNLTAAQFRESSPMLDNLYSRTFKQQESEKDRAFREKQFNSENSKDWARINMQKEAMGARSSGGGGGTSSGRASGGSGKEKEPKEFERKAAGFFNEMQNANNVITQLENSGGYSTADVGIAPFERLKSNDRKKYEAAQKNWAMADLRFKSGAAISDKEIDTHMKTYFPQPGDSREEIKMKQAMRSQVNQNMAMSAGLNDNFKRGAGGSWDNASMPQQSNVLQSAPQGMVEVLDASGNTRAIPREALSEMPKGWRKK